jgi:peptidoglycan/LPS O-acetylase OafA/YrhL
MYSFYISLAYLTLLLAYHPLLRMSKFNRVGDYSYGLYIFGFPVQQSLVYLLGKLDPLLLFGLAFPLILLLAILSWHFIEKPSLSLKGKLTQKLYWRRRVGSHVDS